MKQNYKCPFCGSTNLVTGFWSLDHIESEVKALECKDCYAGAPLDAWRKFADRPIDVLAQINSSDPITVENWNGRN